MNKDGFYTSSFDLGHPITCICVNYVSEGKYFIYPFWHDWSMIGMLFQ